MMFCRQESLSENNASIYIHFCLVPGNKVERNYKIPKEIKYLSVIELDKE